MSEVDKTLNLPDVRDPLGVRDRAILELLYSTGIRRSELIGLDLDDMDGERGLLVVRRGKGRKDRAVPLGEHALYWLGAYLRKTRPLLASGHTDRALFLSGYGERLSVGHLGNWVRSVLNAAGIPRAGACHRFRHACATAMLENGADIRHIQQLLGHERLDTTQIYAAVLFSAPLAEAMSPRPESGCRGLPL